jgi:hypothetical protein
MLSRHFCVLIFVIFTRYEAKMKACLATHKFWLVDPRNAWKAIKDFGQTL